MVAHTCNYLMLEVGSWGPETQKFASSRSPKVTKGVLGQSKAYVTSRPQNKQKNDKLMLEF